MSENTGRRRVRSRSYKKEAEVLKKILEEERKSSIASLERFKYLQADFENHIKRVEREAEEKILRGNEKLIAHLLTIIDDLEKAVELAKDVHSVGQLLEGVRMVLKNMLKILKDEGLEEIKSLGEIFNPSRHEAISQVIDFDHKTNTILREHRKGYMFKGKVLRPSLVDVVMNEEERSLG